MAGSNIDYIPLLAKQRELQGLPRNRQRFEQYLATILNRRRDDVALPPLVMANPMAREHVTALLDTLLEIDADGIARQVVHDLTAVHACWPKRFAASLVVVDDLHGGWTNRYAGEHLFRFESDPDDKRFWITGVLWSSESYTPAMISQTMRSAIHRTDWILLHGPARTLHEKLAQEGCSLSRSGSKMSPMSEDEIARIREILRPHRDCRDMRTAIECLFGDEAGQTLGFTLRGLKPWAGIDLALHDALLQQTSSRLFKDNDQHYSPRDG